MSTETQHWTMDNIQMAENTVEPQLNENVPMAVPRKDYVRVPENLRMLEETMFLLKGRVSQCVVRYEAGDWVIEVG